MEAEQLDAQLTRLNDAVTEAVDRINAEEELSSGLVCAVLARIIEQASFWSAQVHARTDIPAPLVELEKLREEQLRELYADRVRDLEHEYTGRMNAEAEVERLRVALFDIAEADAWVPQSDIGRRMDIDTAKRALGLQP